MTTPRSHSVALVQMHVAAVLFGLSAIFGALIESSATVLVCGRAIFAVGALALALGVRRISPWRGLGRNSVCVLMLSGVLLTIHYVTFFIAIKLGGVAVGSLGFACFPAFVTVFEALAFRERPTMREWVLLLCVTAGLFLITPSFTLADQSTVGLLWGIASGAVYAVLAVGNRLAVAKVSSMQAALWQNGATLLCLLPFTAFGLGAASSMDWLWMACLGILCSGCAYTLYVTSLTALKARLAALIIALEPVYSILFAWLVFSDVPGLRTLLGGACILGAVVWSGRK